MARRVLAVRDRADAVAPTVGDAVYVLEIGWTSAADGRTVDVDGVSYGATTVTVGVNLGSGVVSASVDVGAAGAFRAKLSVPASAATGTVEATNDGGTGSDRVAFALVAGEVELPEHSVRPVTSDRLRYAAGTPDRLHHVRTFVKLDPPRSWLEVGIFDMILGEPGRWYRVNAKKVAKKVAAAAATARKQVAAGTLTSAGYRTAVADALRAGLADGRVRLRGASATSVDKLWSQRPKGGGRVTAQIAGTQAIVVLVPTPADELQQELDELADAALAWAEAHLRLGVLFHERLRFRPANLVLGEPIYQLALTPGEEVQVRQTAETKRRTALTEIDDRQDERESSFSSTWSNDIGSTMASETSFQQGTDIGSGIEGGGGPELPVSVSATVGIDTTSAHGDSMEGTYAYRHEWTESRAAKMRRQHRVQVEIASEDAVSLGTARTLRNHNPLRTVHHTFHKVYRKEQVSLERSDAQLCVRIVVVNPARELRARFLVDVDKLDPAVAAWRAVPEPPGTTHTAQRGVMPGPDDGGFLHGLSEPRTRRVQVDLRAGSTPVPPDQWLIGPPIFTMTECSLFFYDPLSSTTSDDGGDPDLVPEAELHPETQHFLLADRFVRHDGAVRWVHRPQLRTEVATCVFDIDLPIQYSGPTTLFGEPVSEVDRVLFRIQSSWGPNDASIADYHQKVQAERLRLTADFDPDDILDLLAVAQADYPKVVLDRALAEGLTPQAGAGLVHEVFDLAGVVLDNVPYWTEPTTRLAHQELLLRLQHLPATLPLHTLLGDSLTAAQAIVYLPVQRGMEEQALRMLPEAAGHERRIAAEIREFRAKHYGPVAPFAAPSFEQHTAPTTVPTTPPDATVWAQPWEAPPNKFDVLGQWSELVPTDGVHIESQLADTVVTDEAERERLTRAARPGE